MKFNRPDNEVTVEFGYTDGGRVRISVYDTDIGIASNEVKRIFQRFYRVKARSRTAGATGLGLPIVQEVMERMRGSVEVQTQPGRGSTFTILLQSA
jgi:signal transduction histidine kinase